MALPAELVAMMDSTVTVYPFSSINSAGESAYSATGTSYSAHLRGRERLIRTSKNRESIAIMDVYVNSTTISDRDKVVLPISPPTGEAFILLGVTTVHDETAAQYQVLHLGDALSHRNLG